MSEDQDWRLTAELDAADRRGALDRLLGRVRGPDVVEEIQARLPHDVVITHDGRLLFAYAATEEEIRAARAVIEDVLRHEAIDARTPVVLNPAAFTHYSYALRDALAMRTAPLIEVHLTNPAARESFRHISVVAGVADGTVAGFGLLSYELALRAIAVLAGPPAPQP